MAEVTYEHAAGIGRITMDRPPANGWTHEFMHELNDALETAREREPAALVVESEIDGMFCAGGDIKWYDTVDESTMRRFVSYMHKTLRTVEQLPCVVIAAIDGHCLAGGLELALACDVRLASDGPWEIGCPETNIGAIPGGGGTQRLSREVGRGTAIDMLVRAHRLSTSEAHELGILQAVHDPDEFDDAVYEYAEYVADGASEAYAAAKQAVTHGLEMSLDQGLAYEQQLQYELFATDDFAEGVAAFAAGRDPEFGGD
jgi:enoyl-CoA hydratase